MEHEIQLWELNLQNVPRSFNRNSMIEILDEDEKQRLNGIKGSETADQFLFGRFMTKTVLANQLDCVPENIKIIVDKNGKPHLNTAPKTDPVYFNITHTEDIIILAISSNCEVGVDIEKLDRKLNMDRVGKSMFHPTEQDNLSKQPADKKAAYFFKLWTLREAVVKLVGESIFTLGRKLCFDISDDGESFQFIDTPDKNIRAKFMQKPEGFITSVAWQENDNVYSNIIWHQFKEF